MSRHKSRQDPALEYGATDIVSERAGAGVARIKELTKGVGADFVLECAGTNESMHQAINCARDAVTITATPSPCNARARINPPALPAIPQQTDAARKISEPAR